MRGVDVYQGDSVSGGSKLKTIPEKAYKESDFCIVKSTQGVSYKHASFFTAMIGRTIKDGKLAGAYHYAAGHDPVKEADYFISVVKPYLGRIILCLDWERMQNRAWGSKTWCKTFIDRVKARTGLTCFLYVNNEGLKQCANLCGKVPLWFAGFPTNANSWVVPRFKYNLGSWKEYAIWQFTSSYEKIDRNTSPLTKAQWIAYAGGKAETKPAPKTETKSVIKKTADIILAQARSWIGCKESDGSHKKIIDLYNAFRPLPRGYRVKYTDSWCATFVSACAIASNYVDIIPIECSCNQMIALAQKMGIWLENENRTPAPGNIILYNWQDSGSGDDKGGADHVGIVEKVKDGVITVIEGNYKDSVGRRTIKVNAKGIRGYICPKYDKLQTTTKSEPKKEKQGYAGKFPSLPPRGYYKHGDGFRQYAKYAPQIEKLQKLICWITGGKLTIDGQYGSNTEAEVKKAQGILGVKQDGLFGADTLAKARSYKK